jgi:hypothetical protein
VDNEKEFDLWVASIERGDLGYTYIRFYNDAPEWVRNTAINRFGRGTVFLRPQRPRPKVAA